MNADRIDESTWLQCRLPLPGNEGGGGLWTRNS
jgi:hypothetical protein